MKRSLSFLIAFMMLISLTITGCQNETITTESKDSSPSTSEEDVNNYDPFGKYAEPVVVTAVLGFDAPTDPDVPSSTTPENQSFVKVAKDKFNIDLKFDWTVPNSQLEQKFNVTMASGELPDFMSVTASQYNTLKSNGQLLDLTEAYKYASPKFKGYVERDGGDVLKTVSEDGKLFSIPMYRDPRALTPLLWIRADWLKSLNLEIPKTMDQLKTVAKAFVDNKDAYGIGVSQKIDSWGFDIRNYMYSFGAYPKKWILANDGTLVPGEIQPETKKALEFLQTMYKEGLIDKEFAMTDEGKVAEDVIAGKVGLVYGQWWYPEWPLNLSTEKDPLANWVCTEIPSADANPAKVSLDKVMIDKYHVISKDSKNPEAIIKLFNLYCEFDEDNYGKAAKGEGGHFWAWVPTVYLDPYEYDTFYEKANKAIDSNDDKLEGFTQVEKDYIGYQKGLLQFKTANGAWDTKYGHAMARVDKDGGWAWTRKVSESKNFVYNEFYGPATTTQQEKGASLNKLTDETFIRIIMGESPISDFDKYVENWKTLGGNDVIKEVNNWYNENKKQS